MENFPHLSPLPVLLLFIPIMKFGAAANFQQLHVPRIGAYETLRKVKVAKVSSFVSSTQLPGNLSELILGFF